MSKLEIVLRGAPLTVEARSHGEAAFWKQAGAGRWEDDTLAFIDQHVSPSTLFLDIGAWIGPISLYAAAAGGRVLALEPDPVAHKALMRNLALNDASVEVWNAAIDEQAGVLKLFAADGLGQSVTSSIAFAGGEEIDVPVRTFEDLEAAVADHSGLVMKVDIEGHEYRIFDRILAFAVRHGSPLHLSLHPRAQARAAKGAHGRLGARLEAFRRTWRMIEDMSRNGRVRDAESGRSITKSALFLAVVARGRPRNFSVVFNPA